MASFQLDWVTTSSLDCDSSYCAIHIAWSYSGKSGRLRNMERHPHEGLGVVLSDDPEVLRHATAVSRCDLF